MSLSLIEGLPSVRVNMPGRVAAERGTGALTRRRSEERGAGKRQRDRSQCWSRRHAPPKASPRRSRLTRAATRSSSRDHAPGALRPPLAKKGPHSPPKKRAPRHRTVLLPPQVTTIEEQITRATTRIFLREPTAPSRNTSILRASRFPATRDLRGASSRRTSRYCSPSSTHRTVGEAMYEHSSICLFKMRADSRFAKEHRARQECNRNYHTRRSPNDSGHQILCHSRLGTGFGGLRHHDSKLARYTVGGGVSRFRHAGRIDWGNERPRLARGSALPRGSPGRLGGRVHRGSRRFVDAVRARYFPARHPRGKNLEGTPRSPSTTHRKLIPSFNEDIPGTAPSP